MGNGIVLVKLMCVAPGVVTRYSSEAMNGGLVGGDMKCVPPTTHCDVVVEVEVVLMVVMVMVVTLEFVGKENRIFVG